MLHIFIEWSEWSEWSSCSASCGGGTSTSQRKCFPSTAVCPGNKVKTCNTQRCPGNPTLPFLILILTCHKSEDQLYFENLHRKRQKAQKELHGGSSCIGSDSETENCSWLPKCPSKDFKSF